MNQPLDTAISILESEMIRHALRQADGHVSTAAALLGISIKGLYLKRVRLGFIDTIENQPNRANFVPRESI
jgi:DNA-binding NtrC family response regulator